MRYVYTFLAELCCANIYKHETEDKCYGQLGCNKDCYDKVRRNTLQDKISSWLAGTAVLLRSQLNKLTMTKDS